jgi:hypothetical protein
MTSTSTRELQLRRNELPVSLIFPVIFPDIPCYLSVFRPGNNHCQTDNAIEYALIPNFLPALGALIFFLPCYSPCSQGKQSSGPVVCCS